MGDVLQFEAGQKPASPKRRDDIQEVLNYRAAMGQAEKILTGGGALPLCQRVLKRPIKS